MRNQKSAIYQLNCDNVLFCPAQQRHAARYGRCNETPGRENPGVSCAKACAAKDIKNTNKPIIEKACKPLKYKNPGTVAAPGFSLLVREKGLEPSRLWWNTGTSSLPVYLFQHSRVFSSLRNETIILRL